MLQWVVNAPSKLIKYPGIKYQAPKLMYEPKDQANKPVVLMFGWLGAQERHINKYTKLYQDKGTTSFLSYPLHSFSSTKSHS